MTNLKSRIARLEAAKNAGDDQTEVWILGGLPEFDELPMEPFQGYEVLAFCPADPSRVGERRPRRDWPNWPDRPEAA